MDNVAFLLACALLIQVVVCHVCPDLNANSGCSTGSCASGGLPGPWGNSSNGILSQFVSSGDACCQVCKSSSSCHYWVFYPVIDLCNIFDTTPTCLTGIDANYAYAGSRCQKASAQNDPHMTGFEGTPFDFNGLPQNSYCLITDSKLHLNVKMDGYFDSRNESATAFKNGKAIRTWIREIAIFWESADKETHSLKMVARKGLQTNSGNGFVDRMAVDSKEIPRLAVGMGVRFPSGLTVKFATVSKLGPSYEVDHFSVKVAGLLDMDLKLRVAHPKLRTKEDSMAHFSLTFNKFNGSQDSHGVLGQTYRKDRRQRAAVFKKLAEKLGKSIAADGQSGKGFLDGGVEDYVSSDVMAADCKFSRFSELRKAI